MTPAGWMLMLGSCGVVVILMLYCYYRVLSTPQTSENIHAPIEIDTQDADT